MEANSLSTASARILPRSLAVTLLSLAFIGGPAELLAESIHKCIEPDGSTSYSSLPCDATELIDQVIAAPEPSQVQPKHASSRRTQSERHRPGEPGVGEARPRKTDTAAPRNTNSAETENSDSPEPENSDWL